MDAHRALNTGDATDYVLTAEPCLWAFRFDGVFWVHACEAALWLIIEG